MPLHDYQRVGVEWLRSRDRAGLFLDMGLGKTAVALSAMEPRHLPALVVAPKRVARDVWPAEVRKWRPDLTLRVAEGSAADRAAALRDTSADVVAIGRDNVNDLLERGLPSWRTVVVDELSSFKGRGARWKTMRKVCKPRAAVWGLTGTPTPNGYLDLWAEMFLIDDGARLGRNVTGYRNRYFTPGRQIANGTVVSWDLRPESEGHIKQLIGDICLSMNARDYLKDLPPVTYNSVLVELPRQVRRVYDRLNETMVANLIEFFGGELHTAKNAAVMTDKLSQLAAGFLYVDDADLHGMAYDWVHDEKIRAVQEVVEGTGSPVLVFYRFRPELAALRKAFPSGIDITDKSYRQEDWDAGRIPVMFAHPASAGHGLNLQYGCHTAVWTSAPWDLEQWEQGNGRLDRQGQTQPVVVHTIEARASVDQLIRARLARKATVQDDLLNYLRSPV